MKILGSGIGRAAAGLWFGCSLAAWGAPPAEWAPLELITSETGDAYTGSVGFAAMGIRDGNIGVAVVRTDYDGGAWSTRPYYNEFRYSATPGHLGATTRQTITNEPLPLSYGAWGTYLTGMEFDSGGTQMVGCIPYAAPNPTSARILVRTGPGSWTADNATNNVYSELGAFHEAFTLNTSDVPQYVWCSEASGSQEIIHGDKTGGTWHNTVIATPANSVGYPRPDLAMDTNGYPHVSYTARTNTAPSTYVFRGWEDAGGTNSEYVALVGITNPEPWHDIEIDAAGQPMIAHYFGSAIHVKMYDGMTWTDTTAHSTGDGRDYGWLGGQQIFDLEVDGDGNPAMVVVSYDYSAGGTNASLDYCEWNGSSWAVSNIASRVIVAYQLSSAVLEFDESGRPFVLVGWREDGDAYKRLYMTHVPPARGMVITVR